MAKLTGQTIADSYEQLLALPDGGLNGTTLVAITDGDSDVVSALQIATDKVAIDNPTTSSATQGGLLRLQSDDGAAMAAGHRLGVIEFAGAEDASSTIKVGARIEALAESTYTASENGSALLFYTTDGDASQSEQMRITSTGNVGIGTTPASDSRLHLASTTHGADLIQKFSAENASGTNKNFYFVFDPDNENFNMFSAVDPSLVVKSSNGHVGVGVDPSTKLHIEESTAGANIEFRMRALNDGSAGRTASFVLDPDAQTLSLGHTSLVHDINNELVGIGTATPSSYNDHANQLVVASSSNTGITLVAGTSSASKIHFGDGTGDASYRGFINYTHSDGSLSDYFSIGTAGATRMSITSAGDVQFNERLTFTGTNNTSAAATINLNSNNYLYIAGGTAGLIIGDDALATAIQFNDASSMAFDIGGGTRAKLDSNSRISLSNNDSNTNNTVFGYSAFNTSSNNASDNNTVFGNNAMGTGTVDGASYNTAIGNLALTDLIDGVSNVALGSEAGANITIGRYNIVIGTTTLFTEVVGDGTTAVGHGAGVYQQSDVNNEATGNSLFGFVAGEHNVTGTNNTYLGYQSGKGASGGSNSNNTGIGKDSLKAITTGNENTVIGHRALGTATTATFNVAIGGDAMFAVPASQAVSGVVAVGLEALKGGGSTTTGVDNTVAIGRESLKSLSTGAKNIAVGYQAGLAIASSSNNIAIGYQSMVSLVRLDTRNVAIGNYSMDAHTENAYNVAIGYNALTAMSAGNTGGVKATYNTAVGYQAGDALTGGYDDSASDPKPADEGMHNTFIGAETDASAVTGNNQTVIGYNTTGQADNAVTLGNASVTDVYMAQDSGAVVHSGALVNGLTAVNVSTSTLAYDTHQIVRGKYVTVSADAQTITLPAVQIGAVFIIVNIAADGGALLTISPDSGDKFLTNIAGAVGTNDKDITNTKATQNQGDFVKLVGMSADGWAIAEISGVWADES